MRGAVGIIVRTVIMIMRIFSERATRACQEGKGGAKPCRGGFARQRAPGEEGSKVLGRSFITNLIIIIIITIIFSLLLIIFPIAPRIPPHQPSRGDKRIYDMSLLG